MCSKETQTGGSRPFSLLFGFFLCSYRKEQNDCGVQLQGKGVETGYWIDLNTFTDFHGGHLTFEKGGWGAEIKEEGLSGVGGGVERLAHSERGGPS